MKSIGLIFVFYFLLIPAYQVNAQKKTAPELKITFDCSRADNSISIKDLQNCKTLVIAGPDFEEYEICSVSITIAKGNNQKQFVLTHDIFSETFMAMIHQLVSGNKLIIEHGIIKNSANRKNVKLSPITLMVKK